MNKKNVRKMKKRRATAYLQKNLEQKLSKYVGAANNGDTRDSIAVDCKQLLEDMFGTQLDLAPIEIVIKIK